MNLTLQSNIKLVGNHHRKGKAAEDMGFSLRAAIYVGILLNRAYSGYVLTKYHSYIANCSRWKSFVAFKDWSFIARLFQWNSLCNRLWPYKTTIQPQMFSSELQCSFATTKLLASCHISGQMYMNMIIKLLIKLLTSAMLI